MGDNITDLDILPPSPVAVTIGGRSFAVLPLRLRDWPPMIAATEGAWDDLLSGAPARMIAQEARVRAAIAVATGADADWLADLYPAQVLRLFRVIVEVNRDFFGRAVMPEMVALMRGFVPAAPAAAATPAVGPASSPGSSPADTATTTS